MTDRAGNEYLVFPEGTDGRFPDSEIEAVEIVLGEDTVNTCNIALGDVDGDGLDEIATPVTMGEEDSVRLYRGDGSLVWRNDEVRLYHAYYNDPDRPSGGLGHLWHRSKHRHVLTEIADLDDDGKAEVLVGDGPIYVLDARSGDVKCVLDLGGRAALWNVVHDPARKANLLISTVDHGDEGPRVVAVDPAGDLLWTLPTPGRTFCDCMHHGDLMGKGRPAIGFSVEEAKEFWVIDCDGNLLWKKNVPRELGDDPHVDDFLVDRILPEDRMEGNQLLLVTGPNLLDKDGRVIWSRERQLHHAQKVLAEDFYPDRPGKEVYTVESFRRHAHLLTCDGEPIWEYDNFTKARPGHEYEDPRLGAAVGRLTTAGCLVDWTGTGERMIAQTEMGSVANSESRPRKEPIPAEAMRWFMHVLNGRGEPVSIFPIPDSPMCALPATVSTAGGQALVTVGHDNSRMHIFSRRAGRE